MPRGTWAKERKKCAREVPGFTGDVGGEGEIEAVGHKPAQDRVILRYHVLRITVPIHVGVYVYLTVCTCTRRDSHNISCSRYFLFSLFLPSSVLRHPSSSVSSSFLSLSSVSSLHPPPRKASAPSFCRENSSLSRAYPRGRSFATRT